MNRIVISLISVVLLAGCTCSKRLNRLMERCPPPQEIVYNTIIAYRDTIVYREIPGDTIRDSIKVPVEVELPEMALKKRSTLAEATAWVQENQLGLELIQYDSLFQFKLDSAIQVHKDTIQIHDIRTVIKKEIVEKGRFWMHGFLVLAGLILLGLILWLVLRK